ncbi:uncharacterized protein LOC124437449 isoform X2 [Xenia sp. Carnegie-2017]|nr:uncharacterized protein LOC124437449 isoform X2 [Xenia sp. Carnegie-2017]
MFTVNWDTLEGLNNDPRVLGRFVLIPFQEEARSPFGMENQQNAEFENNAIMERGSRAFGTMVAISRSVEYLCITRTNELCQQFTIEAPNIDDCCLRNHALLEAFAEKVIRLASIDDLYPSNAIAFFKQTILPVWMKRFQTNQAQVSHAMLQTEQPIIVDLIMKSIEHKISCKNLLTCVNPKVTFTSSSSGVRLNGVAVALKWFFALLKDHGVLFPNEERVRQEIKSLDIGVVNGRSQYFIPNANGEKISRGSDGVETASRNCLIIQQSAFGTFNILETNIARDSLGSTAETSINYSNTASTTEMEIGKRSRPSTSGTRRYKSNTPSTSDNQNGRTNTSRDVNANTTQN